MSDRLPLMVPGAKPGPEILEVTAPYGQSPIGTLETAGLDAVEQALDTAARLYRDRDRLAQPTSAASRSSSGGGDHARRAEELALEAAREGGKPLIDSRVEVDARDRLREAAASEPADASAARRSRWASTGFVGRIALTRHEPIGVGRGVQRVQPPAEPDRAPGRPGGGRRLPGHREAGRGDAALVHALRRDPARGRAPAEWCQALLTPISTWPARWSRSARRLLQLHRQRRVGWMLRSRARARDAAAPSSTAARRR